MRTECSRFVVVCLQPANVLNAAEAPFSEPLFDHFIAKKLNVLAALEVERYRKATIDMNLTSGGDIAQSTAKTLDTLMSMDHIGAEGSASAKVLCLSYPCLNMDVF